MFLLPKLYMAGVQSGLRGLEHRLRGRSRKQLSVSISQPPLRVALRGRANDATTARQSEGENRHETRDDDSVVQHCLL